jgi:hypothetical protein
LKTHLKTTGIRALKSRHKIALQFYGTRLCRSINGRNTR